MCFKKLVLFIACMFLFGVEVASAQNFGTLRGSVKDPSGALLPEAGVTLKAVASSRTQTTRTNAKGEFIINGIAIGQYTQFAARHGI